MTDGRAISDVLAWVRALRDAPPVDVGLSQQGAQAVLDAALDEITAESLEQAVQSCLVGHEAVDDGGTVAAVDEGHAVEPGGPPWVETPLKADFVPG